MFTKSITIGRFTILERDASAYVALFNADDELIAYWTKLGKVLKLAKDFGTTLALPKIISCAEQLEQFIAEIKT